MKINRAQVEDWARIIALLKSEHLPTKDLPKDLEHFFTAQAEGDLIGLIGMEQHGEYGLLRSMVVHKDYRNNGTASNLVRAIEDHALNSGILTMYLLTNTAQAFFERKQYQKQQRDDTPDPIQQSTEFKDTCPVTATVMKKELAKN